MEHPQAGVGFCEQLANPLITNSSSDVAKGCRTEMSMALWHEDSATCLVLVPRGKLLQHMGMCTGLMGPLDRLLFQAHNALMHRCRLQLERQASFAPRGSNVSHSDQTSPDC